MRAAVLLACLGCGRVAFDPAGDAPANDAAENAAGDAATSCWAIWDAGEPVFTAPVLLTPFDTVGVDHDAALTNDGLVLYFSSARPPAAGGDDVFQATRNARTGPWLSVDHAPMLSSAQDDGKFMTRDDLNGWMSSSRVGGQGNTDLWFAQRASTSQSFTLSQTPLAAVNTGGDQFDPWISFDGLRLYYSNGGTLMVAGRGDTASAFAAPAVLTALQVDLELDPSLSPDERLILYTSNRNMGSRDVMVARRAVASDAFAPGAMVVGLSDPFTNDTDVMLSGDGCEVIYATDRGRAAGDVALFSVRVVP